MIDSRAAVERRAIGTPGCPPRRDQPVSALVAIGRDALERRGESDRERSRSLFLVFAVHLLEDVRALTHRRDDQRGHLDERDRPDQRGSRDTRSMPSRPRELALAARASPPPSSSAGRRSSIQTMAPVAVIDRVDLSESRAWSTPRWTR